jgi:DNA-binding XRE family transcriptional regulator
MATKQAEPNKAIRTFARIFMAYQECSDDIQEVVRDMFAIVADKSADADERRMASDTIMEALFPGPCPDWELPESVHDERELDRQEEHFAGRVSALMGERGMTQADLAKAVGVGQSAVSMMLSRKTRPQMRTVRKIADALGVSADELWPKLRD